jgi:hypothetical protein
MVASRAFEALERFPFRLTIKSREPSQESALDSTLVAFPCGKPVSTFPGNALIHPALSRVDGFVQQSHGAVAIDRAAGHGTVIPPDLPKRPRPIIPERSKPNGDDFSMARAAMPTR